MAAAKKTEGTTNSKRTTKTKTKRTAPQRTPTPKRTPAPTPKPKSTRSSKAASKAKIVTVLHDLASSPSGPQLSTDAIFADTAGNLWVHGSDAGDHVAYRMPETTEVLELSHGTVRDGFTSASGATILATTARSPLLRCADDRFDVLPLRLEASPWSARLDGRAAPEGEQIALLVGFNHTSDERRPAELWHGPPERPERIALDVIGAAVGVAFGDDGAIWAAVQGRRWQGSAPTLLCVRGGEVTEAPLPSDDLDIQGLARTPSGDLLVMLAPSGADDPPAAAWLRRANGTWTKLAPQPLVGWVSTFALRAHRDKVYIPTKHGVFAYRGSELVKESTFYAVTLWPCGERIIARGYRGGAASHDISVGDGAWAPFAVPEPDVVPGGKGKVVYLTEKNVLPVRRVRLPIPKPAAAVPSADAGVFAFDVWLRDLTKRPGAKPCKTPVDVVARVETDIGGRIADDLRRYLEVVGRFDLGEVDTGLWFHMNATGDGYLDTSSVDRFVETGLRLHANAVGLVTDTLAVGGDGSGNSYCVELGPDRSRVFLFEHDTAQLVPLADSLATFAELADVMQRWIDLEQSEGVDIEDHDPEAPSFVALRARARALIGHANAAGDYEDTLPVLAGRALSLKEKSETAAIAASREWLGTCFLLDHGFRKDALAAAKKERRWRREAPRRPSHEVYALLQDFLLEDLTPAAIDRASADHPARVVRIAAEAVRAAMERNPSSPGAQWLAGVRNAMKD